MVLRVGCDRLLRWLLGLCWAWSHACTPDAVVNFGARADLVLVARLSSTGTVRETHAVTDQSPRILEKESDDELLVLYELSARDFRDESGHPIAKEALRSRARLALATTAECRRCLDDTSAAPLRLHPGTACQLPPWFTRRAFRIGSTTRELGAEESAELLSRVEPQLRLVVEGRCACEPEARDPGTLAFERRFPFGAPELPRTRAFDPGTGAVALWFTDRVELRAPGGRAASLALDRDQAQWIDPSATTAFSCSPGADACFAAATHESLLRVRWSYTDGPSVSDQPLPPESHRTRRATPTLLLQGGPRPDHVLLRFAGALNPGFRIQSPSVVTCTLSRCELGSCAGVRPNDLAPLDNLPGPFFPTGDGLRSLTADGQIMTLDLDRPGEPRCSPFSRPEYRLADDDGTDEIIPIRSILDSTRTPTGEIFALVRGPSRTSVIHASSERELSGGGARARIVTVADGVALRPHPFDPEKVQLRMREGGLFLVGRETLEFLPMLASLVPPPPLVWPPGSRTVDPGAFGWLVDTHLGLEWLGGSGNTERLWGSEGYDSLAATVEAAVSGDEVALFQTDRGDGTLNLVRLDEGAMTHRIVRLGVGRGVVAKSSEPGLLRNLRRSSEPLRMEMDLVDLDSGAAETYDLDFGALGFTNRVGLKHHGYVGEGVSLLVVEREPERTRAALLWAPDAGLLLVDPNLDGSVEFEASGTEGAIWGASNNTLYWVGAYREEDGRLRFHTRRMLVPELAAALGAQSADWYLRARASACRGTAQVLVQDLATTRIAELDLTTPAQSRDAALLSPIATKGLARLLDPRRTPVLFQDAGLGLVFVGSSPHPVAQLPAVGEVFRVASGRLVLVSPAGDVYEERR